MAYFSNQPYIVYKGYEVAKVRGTDVAPYPGDNILIREYGSSTYIGKVIHNGYEVECDNPDFNIPDDICSEIYRLLSDRVIDFKDLK